ncbi:MAG: hypothetical protein ACLQAN_06710 [Acidimicrobiales bacterium]
MTAIVMYAETEEEREAAMSNHFDAIKNEAYDQAAGTRIEKLLRAPWKYQTVLLGQIANGVNRDLNAVSDGLRRMGDARWELATSVPWRDDVLLIFKQRDTE